MAGRYFIPLCAVLVLVSGKYIESDAEKGLNLIYRAYQSCEESSDFVPCLKLKAIKLADRALKISNIPLFEGMTIVRNEAADARAFAVTEVAENELPADPDKRDDALDELLIDRIGRFIGTHSVQFSFPKLFESSEEEGRGKMKKYMGPLILAAMMKGGLFAYAMKAVGLLAAKALLVSKIALVLASVVGLKKLFSSGGGAESKTIEIVQKPQVSHSHTFSTGHDLGGGFGGQGWENTGHGGSETNGYGRSFDEAQNLAYRGHV